MDWTDCVAKNMVCNVYVAYLVLHIVIYDAIRNAQKCIS